MFGGRKVRSNKGKKRGHYGSRKHIKVLVSPGGTRSLKTRKVRSNKGKKRAPYGPRTGKTRSGKRFKAKGGAKCAANKLVEYRIPTKNNWIVSSKEKKFPTIEDMIGIKATYDSNKGFVIKEVLSNYAGDANHTNPKGGLKPGMVLKNWGVYPNKPKSGECEPYICGNEERFLTMRKNRKPAWPIQIKADDKQRNTTYWCPSN